jgi:CheY-like chemotaxis protein
MPFSRKGLIEQLEFEGYSTEDATYGVDALDVDWKEQAVKSAENYLDTMPFSRESLIEQLEFEGYSTEDAEYGVTQNGL